MICFGDETDQELKEKGHLGPTFNKKIKKKHTNLICGFRQRDGTNVLLFLYYIFFSSLTYLFDLRKSNRQNSSGQEAKGSTR